MSIEIKNINEYNPQYHKDKSLVWKKIGEPLGKKGHRSKKVYPSLAINKIKIPSTYDVDYEVLSQSREMYSITKRMIPVYLSFDFELLAGFEQLVLAKELKLKRIPFQRIDKMNSTEKKQFRYEVHDKPIGNKKYKVKDVNGKPIYLSLNRHKKIKKAFAKAKALNLKISVMPDFTFLITDSRGIQTLVGNEYKNSLHALNKFLSQYQNDNVANPK